jgi:hypothetical protein
MDLLKTYERLETQDIQEYIQLRQEEHLHLEFKTVQNSDLVNGTTENILRNVSQALPTQTADSSFGGLTREKTNKRSTALRRPKKSTRSSSSSLS